MREAAGDKAADRVAAPGRRAARSRRCPAMPTAPGGSRTRPPRCRCGCSAARRPDVVDLCAAPGGKTAQLASAGAQVTAIDRSTRRLDRLVANLEPARPAGEAIAADALTWRPDHPVDAVLLDAPCTATGAIRRHPDVPHLKQPEDVARLSVVQDNLLRAALDILRPGGILVYCTCSLEPQEGPERVESLLRSGAAGRSAGRSSRTRSALRRLGHRKRRSAHAALPSRRI